MFALQGLLGTSSRLGQVASLIPLEFWERMELHNATTTAESSAVPARRFTAQSVPLSGRPAVLWEEASVHAWSVYTTSIERYNVEIPQQDENKLDTVTQRTYRLCLSCRLTASGKTAKPQVEGASKHSPTHVPRMP